MPLSLREFLPDTQTIGANVFVNQGEWRAQLEANKQSYFGEFVLRPAFEEIRAVAGPHPFDERPLRLLTRGGRRKPTRTSLPLIFLDTS